MIYKDFNLQKIDIRILQNFDTVKELPDNSKVLIRYKNEPGTMKTLKNVELLLKEYQENKTELEILILIYRSSVNWYVVTAYTPEGVTVNYFSTIGTVSAFIKENYCKTVYKDLCTL